MTGDWQDQNRRRVMQKLDWLREKPQGVLFEKRTEANHILLLKHNDQIQLYFTDARLRREGTPKLSGAMSRIDLRDPFTLPAPYTQAMMLTLAWVPDPKRVFVLGFGGGRVPMVLHHHFPDCRIESAEIDRDVIELSSIYFGIECDDRLSVAHQDGVEFLRQTPEDAMYDIIMIDAFVDAGDNPSGLNTDDFYRLCLAHLTADGIVCVNLLSSDPLLREKMRTFRKAFGGFHLFEKDGSVVLYGTRENSVKLDDLPARADAVQKRSGFAFPFVELIEFIRRF